MDEEEDQAWADVWRRLGADERRRLLRLAFALLRDGARGSGTS